MHECPLCGSQTLTCKHCGWKWSPRDPENIPDTCPRCRNKWNVPFKWNVISKFHDGTIDPNLYHDHEKTIRRLVRKIDRQSAIKIKY